MPSPGLVSSREDTLSAVPTHTEAKPGADRGKVLPMSPERGLPCRPNGNLASGSRTGHEEASAAKATQPAGSDTATRAHRDPPPSRTWSAAGASPGPPGSSQPGREVTRFRKARPAPRQAR